MKTISFNQIHNVDFNQEENAIKAITPLQVNRETIIFTEIRHYLKNNRIFKLDKVIPFLNSRFAKSSININKKGIAQILKSLLQEKLIIEGSKLTREDFLQNTKRKQIYKFIKENPGVYCYQIMKELYIGGNTVQWHLDILYNFKLIAMIKEDNHKIYFDIEVDSVIAKNRYYINNNKSKKIMKYLESNDIGMTKTKICKDLKMHPNTATKYISILVNLNILEKQVESNKTFYFLK